jgi:hypothetical protein
MSFEDDLDLIEVAIWLAILGGIAYVVWKYVIPLFYSATGTSQKAGGLLDSLSCSVNKLQKWASGSGITATPAGSQTGATIQCKMPCGQQSSVACIPVSAGGSPTGGGCATGTLGVCTNGLCC